VCRQQAAARVAEEENAVSFCSNNLAAARPPLYFAAALSFRFFLHVSHAISELAECLSRQKHISACDFRWTWKLHAHIWSIRRVPLHFPKFWLHFRRVAVLDFLNPCIIYGTDGSNIWVNFSSAPGYRQAV